MSGIQLIHREALRAPFPWFGGKRRVAPIVWERIGDVDSYNEPFAGSLAVLLGRPHEPRVETVNDLDCYLALFWRSLKHDPDAVAYHADWPVNEADLHARHRWLVETARERAERVMTDPDFYDPKIAGWWVWGQCLWIGSGWCQKPEWTGCANAGRRPRGVNAARVLDGPGGEQPWKQRKRPSQSRTGTSVGVHRRRWQGGGQGGGSGVHAPTLTRQLPQLSGDAGAVGRGIHGTLTRQMPQISAEGGSISGVTSTPLVQSGGLYDYLRQLAARLRRVRVCCGDWRRVLTPSVTTYIGTTGVFLDPPYSHDLRERCYSEDHDISADVRAWAIEHGDDPKMRIAICGYEGEHEMPDTWSVVAWKAHGGYSRTARGVANRDRERIWFSPHCQSSQRAEQASLFAESAS